MPTVPAPDGECPRGGGGGIVKIFTLDDFHRTTSLGLLPSIRYQIRYQIRCRTFFFFSLRVLQKDLSIP